MSFKSYLLMTLVILLNIFSCDNDGVRPKNTASDYEIETNVMPAGDKNLYYSVLIPGAYSAEKSLPLVLALHFGGPTTTRIGQDFITSFVYPALKKYRSIIAAPVCPVSNGWANSFCETAVISMLDSIKSKYNIDSSKIIVTGYSMGAEGTWYFAVKHPEIFKAAIPVSGGPPAGILPINSIIPTYIIHSADDEIVPVSSIRTLAASLKDAGLNVKLEIIEGPSHYYTNEFIEPLSETVPWIEDTVNQ